MSDARPTPAKRPAKEPLAAPAGAVADWRQDLPEEWTAPGRDETGAETQIPLRRHPALAKYASKDEAIKALVHAQRLLGRKGEALPGSEDGGEPEGSLLSLARSQGQAPASPEDYVLPEVELPEDFSVDENLRQAFLAKAHELGLSDSQAGGLYAWFLPLNVAALQAHVEAVHNSKKKTRARELAGLRHAHGDEALSVLESARRAVMALGGKKLMATLEQCGAADNACVVQAFARIAPQVSEAGLRDRNPGPAGTITPQRLREMMRDPRYFDPSRRDGEFVRQVQQGFEALYPGEQAPAQRAG